MSILSWFSFYWNESECSTTDLNPGKTPTTPQLQKSWMVASLKGNGRRTLWHIYVRNISHKATAHLLSWRTRWCLGWSCWRRWWTCPGFCWPEQKNAKDVLVSSCSRCGLEFDCSTSDKVRWACCQVSFCLQWHNEIWFWIIFGWKKQVPRFFKNNFGLLLLLSWPNFPFDLWTFQLDWKRKFAWRINELKLLCVCRH